MHPSTSTQPVPSVKGLEAANMVEVDTKLFVTCRLCLEDMGVYQIVPAVQQHIKYCFDIDVDSFDGLPQLLCKKCETLLCDYYKTKKTFIEKQKTLMTMKLNLKMEKAHPQQETVSSSQQMNGDNNLTICHKQTKKTKRKRVISTTTDSDSSTDTAITKSQSSSVTEFNSSKSKSWESDYSKLFVCKLCNGYFCRKNGILSHHRHSHKQLMSKYQNILKSYCTVKLTRLDYKPNITGDIKRVVHSFQKITQEGDSYYYVMYLPKETFDGAVVKPSELISSNKPVPQRIASDSSIEGRQRNKRKSATLSSGDESIKELKRRKSRLISASSNETVVIGNKRNKSDLDNDGDDLKIKTFFGGNKNVTNYIDCIDIEDSSDNSSNKSNCGPQLEKVSREPIKVKLQETKAILNIVSLCHKKYTKRKEASQESDTENKKPIKDYLKHKVLSIGRKNVTKRGFNCNGLLRYMESKSLELVWLPRSQQYAYNKGISYIQINAELRHSKENGNDFNKSEWKSTTQIPQDNEEHEDTEAVERPSSLPVDNNTRQTDITLPSSVVTIQRKGNEPIETDCAVLYPEPSNAELKSKLLNKNPVANPRHFPKKGNLTTSKFNMSNVIYDDVPNVADVIENDSSLCLPIITSTTSLAVVESTEQIKQSVDKNTTSNSQSSVNTNVAPQMSGPRIKVKPVTELLSERILHSIMNSQTNQNTIQGSTSQNQNISQPLQVVETSSSLHTPVGMVNEPSITLREYVILDTVEFPNTKTDSPFRYLKNLLQIHNIVLLDTDYILTRDFTCLIKFKVLYKQETKDQPVILCLSLFCFKNIFCLKIKDRNQENINMTKISANWQWELLKIYKGDVVNKVLQNALKVSQEMHGHTKTFLCLLESINYKTNNEKIL